MEVFKALKIADLGINPATEETWTIGESADDWLLDFAAAIFGAYNAETGEQLIREGLLLVSKKNTKSTIAAGIMLTELICGWRPSDENLILAPTIEVAGNSFKPACDMIRADEELTDLLHIQEHVRLITNRDTKATLKVVAADAATVSGKKASRVLVDELWLFGKKANADSMLREAAGGQVSRPEGYTLYLTTQSDEPPAGVFKEKLAYARDVRDGKVTNPEFLPVLYEFPEEMLAEGEHLDPANFYITNPNMGRSVSQKWLEGQFRQVENAEDGTKQVFYAKHLGIWVSGSDGPSNVGVGVGSGDIVNGFNIGFQATSGGKYTDSAFVAEGLGYGLGTASAYKARGSHSVGINFQDANFTGPAILLPDGKSRTNGIRFGGDQYVWQDASPYQGDAQSGLQIGSNGRVGFGVPSVPRPTLPPAAVSLDGIYMLLNQMRSALIANGLAQ